VELKITSVHAFRNKMGRLSYLPVVDGTESVELKITSPVHAYKNKMAAVLSFCSRWNLECMELKITSVHAFRNKMGRLSYLPVLDGGT
jgi:hypothetical protein